MVIATLLYDLFGKYGVVVFISISLSLAIKFFIEYAQNKQNPSLNTKKGVKKIPYITGLYLLFNMF